MHVADMSQESGRPTISVWKAVESLERVAEKVGLNCFGSPARVCIPQDGLKLCKLSGVQQSLRIQRC